MASIAESIVDELNRLQQETPRGVLHADGMALVYHLVREAITAAGGNHDRYGYVFSDGSRVHFTGRRWVAPDAAQQEAMATGVVANSIDLVGYKSASAEPWLSDQLEQQGISYIKGRRLPIVGMGGDAWLLNYLSPEGGEPVTVLVVPRRHDVDDFGEDYFYFRPLSLAQADEKPDSAWLLIYYECRRILKQAERLIMERD